MVLPFPSLSFFTIPVTLFLKQSFKFLTVCDTALDSSQAIFVLTLLHSYLPYLPYLPLQDHLFPLPCNEIGDQVDFVSL